MAVVPVIDLACDLNAEDDDGCGWAVLANAREPESVRPGVVLNAGTPNFWATVRVIAVDDDGQVHFEQLDGATSDSD